MLNVLVPQVRLNIAGRHSLLCQMIATAMPQHVGMHRQRKLSHLASSVYNLGDRIRAQFGPPLPQEHIEAL